MKVNCRSYAWLALLWLATIILGGCPPKTVIIDGREVPVAEAARLDFQEARKALEAGLTQQAINKLELFVKNYPDAEQMDQALVSLGDLYYQSGNYEKAVESYRTIMADYPQSPRYIHAAIQLGMALFKADRRQEALPTLQSVFDQLSDSQKQAEVAGMLADSYLKTGAPVEALRWYSVLYKLTNVPGAKQALYKQVIDIIDRHMSFVQIREALELLTQEEVDGFPVDLLQFKLAKIFYHILDFETAQRTLEDFVANYPNHELIQEAGKLLTKIMDRSRVNPQSVGVLLPLSGQLRDYGRLALEGIQLGAGIFDDLDSTRNIPEPVLVIRDTGGDPDQAIKQFEELVFTEHVIAVIGPMTANAAQAVAVKAEELQVPIITLSKKKDITQIGPYVFRNFLTLAAQAKLLVSHAMHQLGATKFALLYPNDYYGVEFTNAFWDQVDRLRGEIRAVERYEPDTKNFSQYIKKMVGRYHLEARKDFMQEKQRIRKEINKPLAREKALKKLIKTLNPIVDFQAIFVPDYVDNAVLIAPALAFEDIILKTESQYKIDRMKKSLGKEELDMVYLLGGNGWNSPKVVEWARRYVQGTIFCDSFFLQSNRPATRRFVKDFIRNFDHEPSAIEAEAFDTAVMVRNIIEKEAPPDRNTFRESLLRTKNFPGASGNTSFLPDGDVEKELFLLTITKDQIVEVDTRAHADAGS